MMHEDDHFSPLFLPGAANKDFFFFEFEVNFWGKAGEDRRRFGDPGHPILANPPPGTHQTSNTHQKR
jgi:hypothetical protein